MSLHINDDAPDFTAETTQDAINFHEWIGDGWAVLFSHPKDFTPVCTTELGYTAGLKLEFDKRNCKIMGLSVDFTGDHEQRAKDMKETQGHAPNYPLIGDTWGTEAVGPDKKIKFMLTDPMSTGRNFDEVLRVLDSIQLTAKHKVATPVNWKNGEDVIIIPAASNEEAEKKYPGGWKSPKPYIRIVPQPE
jgi:alkyl hydroperoxide reductase subunit AhpC